MDSTMSYGGTENQLGWDGALKIISADGKSWSYVSATNPLPVISATTAQTPTPFNATDISSTMPLPCIGI